MAKHYAIRTLLAAAASVAMLGNANDGTDAAKQARICQENLAKIDGSKEQFALEYKLPNSSAVTWQNLIDPGATGQLGKGYLKRKPVCPSGGTYSINAIGKDPTCSIAPVATASDITTTSTVSSAGITSATAHVLQ